MQLMPCEMFSSSPHASKSVTSSLREKVVFQHDFNSFPGLGLKPMVVNTFISFKHDFDQIACFEFQPLVVY